jgi:hypothetical protein
MCFHLFLNPFRVDGLDTVTIPKVQEPWAIIRCPVGALSENRKETGIRKYNHWKDGTKAMLQIAERYHWLKHVRATHHAKGDGHVQKAIHPARPMPQQ